MEGSWRGVASVATLVGWVLLAVGASGCSDAESGATSPAAIETANPEQTFAPLIELAADEPWRPMRARWFIERSTFWFAEDDGCADRKIAVGHTLPEQQNPTIDWIYPKGLGGWSWPSYDRNPYDAKCEYDFDKHFYADQLTRPHDPGVRVEGIHPGEGFYLDLVDEARRGPASFAAAPTYVERVDEGDSGVRLTYWMLFGMHGTPGGRGAHEGDWQRVDVLLRADDGGYEPQAVQLLEAAGAQPRDTAWGAALKVGETHPVVTAARATHSMTVAAPGESCADCVQLPTWKSLVDARKELWYGFGGAWGQVGATSATTGPLGPHRFWPSVTEKEREFFGG